MVWMLGATQTRVPDGVANIVCTHLPANMVILKKVKGMTYELLSGESCGDRTSDHCCVKIYKIPGCRGERGYQGERGDQVERGYQGTQGERGNQCNQRSIGPNGFFRAYGTSLVNNPGITTISYQSQIKFSGSSSDITNGYVIYSSVADYEFFLVNPGVYLISYKMTVEGQAKVALRLNGLTDLSTGSGTLIGGTQINNAALIRTLIPNTILWLLNRTSNNVSV